ncbi:MAG: hypothetical protein C6W57_01240 [Caldibacillus debilis]|uniref:hypothetical protein n=1 Tax=Caldibacillus debilis TaxID=301148 RepID=UPI000B57EC55|nr:hypothetical protein [Caldibacillus debilis]OUM86959.1 MAG: hypothetical protein BAA03_15710 [Caldibacillus debilis]REJ19451.1 MAG: hypothetical protein C6W57_01240 [Caldibacillus debilis]REJ31251.1 MAG: hypothetical protein C6W56_00630 [Caldibacillus debilis]
MRFHKVKRRTRQRPAAFWESVFRRYALVPLQHGPRGDDPERRIVGVPIFGDQHGIRPLPFVQAFFEQFFHFVSIGVTADERIIVFLFFVFQHVPHPGIPNRDQAVFHVLLNR